MNSITIENVEFVYEHTKNRICKTCIYKGYEKSNPFIILKWNASVSEVKAAIYGYYAGKKHGIKEGKKECKIKMNSVIDKFINSTIDTQ